MKIDQLVGSYHNAGYGTLNLRLEKNGNESILVADRRDLVEAHQLRFHHVSGSFWDAALFYYATNSTDENLQSEFRFDVEGEPVGLDIQWTPPEQLGEGIVSYKRV